MSEEFVYIVQTWNEKTIYGPDGPMHDIYFVHAASDLNKALQFCRNNSDYAGDHGWHWWVSQVAVDQDEANTLQSEVLRHDEHYTRDGRPCDASGSFLEEEHSYDPVQDEIREKLFELIEDHSEKMKNFIDSELNNIFGV